MFCILFEIIREIPVPYIVLVVICTLYIRYISINRLNSREYGLSSRKSVLLLTAHPDDEVMFFTPTILTFRDEGHKVFVVCFSKGNYYGEGDIRKKELLQSCKQLGINDSQVTIIDDSKFPDNPRKLWPLEDLGEKILSVADRIKPHSIITFDKWGVSGHANHKALYHAVRKLHENGKLSKDISVFTLESTNIFRKYISWLDIPWSCFTQKIPTVFVCSPSQFLVGCKAMACHQSQMVWFRKLYIVFSRYMVVNTLQEMSHNPVNNKR